MAGDPQIIVEKGHVGNKMMVVDHQIIVGNHIN